MKNKTGKGQAIAALAIALFLTLLAMTSVALVLGHVWWLPVDVSSHGPALDHQLSIGLLAIGVLFAAGHLGLAYAVWKYRARGDGGRARAIRGHVPLEVLWTLCMAVLFLGLGAMGYRLWARMYLTPAPPGSILSAVQGYQFAYSFRYPGPDGKLGPVHTDKIDDAAGNPWGLDRDHDPASRDDIVTATMAVPLNRPVELLLSARDVGHSFDVRELRVQQDMVPGLEIPVHFTATRAGEYEIICTQLCGLGHYRMRAFLRAMPETEFESWITKQAAAQ